MVLACDGIFDVLSNDEVARLVLTTAKDATMCARRILSEAFTKVCGMFFIVIYECIVNNPSGIQR